MEGGQEHALFFVEPPKSASSSTSSSAQSKPYRLLPLQSLGDIKEEVKQAFTSSPLVYAAASGKQEVVALLIDSLGCDYTATQSVYTAVWEESAKKWSVDHSQGKTVSARDVGLANGFDEVSHGGCRMCATGDCVLM